MTSLDVLLKGSYLYLKKNTRGGAAVKAGSSTRATDILLEADVLSVDHNKCRVLLDIGYGGASAPTRIF